MSFAVQPFTTEWRERWQGVADSLRLTGTTPNAEEADMIERILREQSEAAARDAAEHARILRERTGTVKEVADETGYDPAYLYQLLKVGTLVNRNPDERPVRVRYSDVWALKGVPIEIVDACLAAAVAQQPEEPAARPVSPERVVVRVVK